MQKNIGSHLILISPCS